MKTNFNNRTSRSLGIWTLSATMLSLLGGLIPASAQSSSPGARIPLPAPQSANAGPVVPLTPKQAKTARPARSRSLFLPSVSRVKHPIDRPVHLADPSVLAGPPVALEGHIPGQVAHAIKGAPLDPNQQMTIAFTLKPRNRKEMDDLARRLYDPNDPQFHHFLTPDERVARFSPSQEDFNKVVACAQRMGLRVTDSSVARRWVQASGTVHQIQNALGLHLDNYKAADGSVFYAPDSDPKLPRAIAPLLTNIEQLNNIQPHSNAIFRPASPPGAKPNGGGVQPDGGGGGGGAQPADIGIWDGIGIPAAEIKTCYQLNLLLGNTVLNGAGQRVALVELGGYDPNDINYYVYYNNYLATPTANLAYTPLQIHGDTVGINGDSTECELDIEMLEAVADGLTQIDIYEQDPAQLGTVDLAMDSILNDDVDNQVSVSYDVSEVGFSPVLEGFYDDTTEEMALQGQAVFVASGDWGSTNWKASGSTTGTDVNYYAASSFVTGVGGTTLYINETNTNYGALSYETSWSETPYATGGGVSRLVGIPDYQANYLANDPDLNIVQASVTNRNIPDVALDADPNTGYYTHILGHDVLVGGTSASTPLWAGFWAQLNQACVLNGRSQMGFGNPALYSIASGSQYSNDFHDVVIGDTNGYNYQGGYYPYYGYDLTTGLGSLNGLNLINSLLTDKAWAPVESLSASPTSVISGNQINLQVALNPSVPQYGSATVVWATVIGGAAYQIGTSSLNGGDSQASFSTLAPEVKTPTQENYICYVLYYDFYGQQRGGAYWSNYASTTVTPNTLSGLSVSSPAFDGLSVTGTITLSAPAAQNEQIDLTSSTPAKVTVPASVTIAAGEQEATFTINSKLVMTAQQVAISAHPDSNNSGLGSGQATTQVTIAPLLSAVKLTPSTVVGGLAVKGTVVLSAQAPFGGALVTLASANPAATVPANVTVPAGSTSVSFTIPTTSVSTSVSGAITATHGAASKKATLKVTTVGVSSLTLSPSSVEGGGSVTGKVTLQAAAGPGNITVSLSSSAPSVAYPMVNSITIPAGSTTGIFTVKTNRMTATSMANITATANGISKSKALKVTP